MLTIVLQFMRLLTLVIGLVLLSGMLIFALASKRENEPRAVRRALLLALALPLPYLLVAIIPFRQQIIISALLVLITVLAAVVLAFPAASRTMEENETPHSRFDERDIMFSRIELRPGTERYREYYRRHPQKKVLDDRFRRRPGLLQPQARYYDPLSTAAANPRLDAALPHSRAHRREHHDPMIISIGHIDVTHSIQRDAVG